jgi:DNA-binding CsgD family transcriptional regulator/outer membrane lipoprotein-sorting protein
MRGGTTTGAHFREARRHERELNERQREVLALVADGLTNAEIGERLGMTLDGAKWNVSEILTKLGLASREEAAAYWRWRHGSRWSRVRGWLGAPLLKVAGAGAAAVLGTGVVAALFSEDEAPPVDEPGRPFYLEAELEVVSYADSIGSNPVGTPPSEEPQVSRSVIRWAWQDMDHSRYEVEALEPAIDSGVFLVVADGSKQWVYQEQEGTFREDPLPPLPDGFRVRPIGISVIVGTAAWREDIRTVDEFVTLLNEGRREITVRVTGAESYLGRTVTVVSSGPVGCSSTSTWEASGNETHSEERCTGSSELWIDEERMMVLRHIVNNDAQSIDARVTRLDYDTEFEDSRFEFQPPAGAVLKDDDSSSDEWSGGVLSPGQDPPSGYLRLGLVPSGYEQRGVAEGESSFEQQFEGPNGLVFTVNQRKRAMPSALKVGKEHDVRGLTVYAATNPKGWNRLAWEESGVSVVLEGESMPVEQMLAIAESMQLAE